MSDRRPAPARGAARATGQVGRGEEATAKTTAEKAAAWAAGGSATASSLTTRRVITESLILW